MKLKITKRSVRGKATKLLRKQDQIPGIVYARHISDPFMISFRRQDFVKLYKQTGSSTPITIEGDDIEEMVLVHDIQIDPVNNFVTHVDFLWIKKGEKVSTEVPLVIQWEAPVTKTGGARIQQTKYTLHIEAMPKDLPHEIFVDISVLETTDDSLFVKDLPIPSWVEVKDDDDLSVAIVVDLSNIKEEEPVEEEITDNEWSKPEWGEDDSADGEWE